VTNKKPTVPAGDQAARPDDRGSASSPSSPDVALIHGVTPDGGLQILRARENRLELGAIRPLREGAPITGEVVTLRPRANFPALCDVETHFKPPSAPSDTQQPRAALPHAGPAQVATDDYRRNWDAIWSSASDKPKLIN
jgi:hypothetical protein